MAEKTVQELYNQFKALSPQERNDAIQAMYVGVLASKYTEELTEDNIALLKAICKSFDISIKFEELNRNDDTDIL